MKEKKGMSDITLEVTPSQMEDILERTPIAQQEFRGLRDRLDTFTREELQATRDKLKTLSQPQKHIKTPLPNPPQ